MSGLFGGFVEGWVEIRGLSWDGQLLTMAVMQPCGPVQLFYKRGDGDWIPGPHRERYNDITLRELGRELDRMITEVHRGTFVPERSFLALNGLELCGFRPIRNR